MSTALPSTDAPAAGPDSQSGCPVCDHDLSAHDAVSRRFCLATQSRALTRNCLCRSYS